MISWIQLLVLGLVAASGNLLGGALITQTRTVSHNKLRYLVAAGAGFMLATVILEVIPASAESHTAMIWLLAGYLLIQLVEHTIAPHFHFGEETHTEEVVQRGAAATAVIALSVHAFFDGVTIASGLLTNLRLGLLLFAAVMLHKIPEGFTAASILLAAGRSRQSARRGTVLIALTTLAGVVSVAVFQPGIRYTLPLSAGVTLYVAASDLIPEVNREHSVRASLMVFAGVALFYLTHLLLHEAIE
jgi:zinc transporter ZupT